jgi:hypothetical protein
VRGYALAIEEDSEMKGEEHEALSGTWVFESIISMGLQWCT